MLLGLLPKSLRRTLRVMESQEGSRETLTPSSSSSILQMRNLRPGELLVEEGVTVALCQASQCHGFSTSLPQYNLWSVENTGGNLSLPCVPHLQHRQPFLLCLPNRLTGVKQSKIDHNINRATFILYVGK